MQHSLLNCGHGMGHSPVWDQNSETTPWALSASQQHDMTAVTTDMDTRAGTGQLWRRAGSAATPHLPLAMHVGMCDQALQRAGVPRPLGGATASHSTTRNVTPA